MPAKFSLPPLPFKKDALAPAISADTFSEHHGGHHKAYVDKLNSLATGDLENASLLDIIRETADVEPEEVSEQVSAGDIFVHAAQHFNHSFYWKSLSPAGGEPTGELLTAIERDFGSVENLKNALVDAGVNHFASGWVWLVADEEGVLDVLSAHDAQTPVIDEELRPILVIDVWEHAYYIDHRRARKAYLDAVVAKHLNWAFAAQAYTVKDISELDLGIANG